MARGTGSVAFVRVNVRDAYDQSIRLKCPLTLFDFDLNELLLDLVRDAFLVLLFRPEEGFTEALLMAVDRAAQVVE